MESRVNAGDSANAPEFDYYGQPRDDGAPDIGIYELAGGMSQNDLAAVSVSSTGGSPVQGNGNAPAARSTIGDTLTISYSVANVGKQAVSGSWRDRISLVSPDGGYSIDLGTAIQTAMIGVGATNIFNASFVVPTEAEGRWRVAVGVNAERDIYEGVNVTNNAVSGTETIEISMPDRFAADGFSGTAAKGAPAVAKFALDGNVPMVARINAPAGTVVYLGSGFMPNASSYSARAVVGENGGLIGIPAGVTSAYLLVETTSSKGVTFTMTLESAALAVQSVSPATLPYAGTTGLVIDGANFAEGCEVVLERIAGASGTGEPPVLLSSVVSATRMTAQIDCAKLTAGEAYSVTVVSKDGSRATLSDAVTVASVPAEPRLNATLDAPENVRRGRTLTVYIDYENTGNADMPVPIFELISTGQVFKVDGNIYTNSVKVMGLSAEAPVGTLRPGEPQRLGVTVTILSENVKWKLRSYHAAQEGAKKAKFSLRELYDEDWVLYHVEDDNATIANLRKAIGATFADYYTSFGAWLGTVEPQTTDYETLKSAFGKYQYLKASGMLDVGTEDSGTDGSPVQNMNAQAARSTSAPRLLSEPTSEDDDVILASEWKSKYPRDGSVWMWDSTRENWILAVKEENGVYVPKVSFDSSKITYIICHGNNNSIETPWLRQYALNLPSGGVVLAVNWGDGARCLFGLNPGTKYKYLAGSASHIPRTVNEAIEGLKKLGLDPEQTIMIGHSHGGHVAANIMTRWTGTAGKFNRLVGLDTSTQDLGVHGQNTMSPNWWMSRIRKCCKQTEFYRSSWELSLEEKDELWAEYNFALADKNTLYDFPTGFLSTTELGRHSFAHQWFLRTIQTPSVYPHTGFGFLGKNSWDKLCANSGTGDIQNPGSNKLLAGVIRMNRLELASFAKTDANKDGWRYAETILNDENRIKKSMYQLRNNSARTIEFEIQSIVTTTEDSLLSGNPVTLTVKNNADNLSIPYMKPVSDDPAIWPWRNKLASGVWMVDLDGLQEESMMARSIEDWGAVSLDELKNMVGNRAYLVRLVSSMAFCAPNEDVMATPFVLPTATAPVQLGTRFDNDLFGESRPLVSRDVETGVIKWRKILLVAVAGVDSSTFGDGTVLPSTYKWDIYPKNNVTIKQITAIPANAIAVISKTVSRRKVAYLKSAQLLSRASTHQLSENALKPGEVVTVTANSNGVWSIALDCSESYTTSDEDEIIANRFELIDAGNEDGAARFQNNKTIYDMPYVTVSGTLPQTTDADGNPVCEGRCYTVQLTVMATDEEDAVTTCMLDVRSPTDADDGEDEDEDDSNELKSCDPNEMVGPEGLGSNRLVKPGEWMTYTIYFENKADAEAAAASVTVTNPLSEAFDWSTFEMLDVGFGNQIDLGLSGKHEGVCEQVMDDTNTSVRTKLTIDETTGVAEWYLRIVDPNGDAEGWPLDVYAGFLPPNNPETHCGEGHLTYRIKLRDDAPHGVVVTNSASIVFDYNDPIETDPAWWNTVGVPGAGFGKSEINAEEGEYLTFTISGGAEDKVSSVKLYLTYNTASAADIDLKNGTVDSSTGGSPVPNAQAARSTNLKFPLTLTWAAGEIGEKTITIPVLADKAIEDAEQFTLQLADPVGMELGETRLCTVTITDPGYAELEAKIAAGTATKAEKTAWDKLQKAKAPYIRGVADPANAGKVTGSGLCASGKKVTLKAAANKGYVFTGWLKEQIALDGDRLVTNAVEYVATTPSLVIDRTAKPAKDTATSTTLTNVNDNATFYATFITTDEDKAAVGLTLNGGEMPQVEDNAPSLVTNIMCGVALNWPLASSALSQTTVKVAGLPAGLKFTAKDIMKKGSKTEVEIPANTIYGVPTAASKIDKKTGLPVPSAVKVTVTTAGKSSVAYLMNITVDALPAWAVGNFEGFVSYDENDGGFATMSISAVGKISGKIAYGGTNWTFKVDSYDITSETVGSTNFIVETVAVSGKATRKLWMTITDIGRDYLPDSAVAFVDGNFGDMLTEMHRLPWKDKGAAAAAAALVASYAGAYSCTVPYGEDAGDVTFILDEKGMVKGTVVLPDGDKTRKATFSSNALTGGNSLSVVIALPPDAKKGYPAVFKVVNLVNHSGEGADNLAFRDPGVVAAVAELTAESGAIGTVSVNPKYGQVAPGKDVTLTAKAAKGSVFHRWEITGVDTEGLDISSATLKFKMTDAGDVFVTAVFVTAEEDAASIALSVDALGGEISPEAIISVTNTCGVALKWSVAADALSQPTVAVSGLPAGLKFTAKDIMKKGSKTEVEIPANTIYGAPTAESKLDAKTGLRKPSAVKFTVTTAGKSKRVYPVDMTVLPLPDWAVGTFNGGGDLGQVSLTIAKTGKLSGKYLSEGLTWTLASDSFDSIDASGDVYRATLIGKSGKLVMTNEIGVAGNAIGGYAAASDYIAYQNNWKLEPWKSVGKPFAKAVALEYEDSASVAGVPVPGVLSLKFAASGAVTVKGSFITGINEKTGKEILYSASGTAVLAPQREPDANGAFDAVVFVYLPPKAGKFDGYVRCIGVRWTGEGWIKR